MRFILSVTVLLLSVAMAEEPNPARHWPFGFEFGMSKEAAIQKIGRGNVLKDAGDTVIFSTAPQVHPQFEHYVVMFSPTRGLVKVDAYSKEVETNGYGEELRSRFSSTRQGLTSVYGNPSTEYDFVRVGGPFQNPEDFMMSLLRKQRTLLSAWLLKDNANHITSIILDTQAEDSLHGRVSVSYEFDGFTAYINEKEKKANAVF